MNSNSTHTTFRKFMHWEEGGRSSTWDPLACRKNVLPNQMTINDINPYIDTESFLKCTWLCGMRICVIPNVAVSTVQYSLPSEESLIHEKNAARKFGIVDTLV